MPRTHPARRLGGGSRRCRAPRCSSLALAAVAVVLCTRACELVFANAGFSRRGRYSWTGTRALKRDSGASGQGFDQEDKTTGKDGALISASSSQALDISESKKNSTRMFGRYNLAKTDKEKRAGPLTTTRLKDLKDKTLANRIKREAEIDEYEEGRAMIAKYGAEVGVMPPKVAERAAKRGLIIGGAFYGVMLALFAGGAVLYRFQDIIIPPGLMAFWTSMFLVLAMAGGTYGLLSASWEEDKEGSLWGVEEFKFNVKVMGDGFRKALLQPEYEQAISERKVRRKLLAAKEEKKRELLNK